MTAVTKNYIEWAKHRFEKKFVKVSSGCWEWSAAISNGYGYFGYNKLVRVAHRVSWMLYVGDIPKDRLVLHKCNNRKCVNPDHLYIGSQYDNVMDSVRAGTHYTGARLNRDDVLCIKKMLRDNIPQWLIAWTYKVAKNTISQINTGHRWSTVTI